MVNLKYMTTIALMLSVILIAGCTAPEPQGEVQQDYGEAVPDDTQQQDYVPDDTQQQDYEQEQSSATPITGNVVAEVNGEEVHSDEVEQIQQSLSMQGQEVSSEDALDEAIIQKILEQKIKELGIEVTDEEAESAIEEQLAAQGASLEDYKQQIETQGISYESQLEDIKEQLATQRFLESQTQEQSVEITEEEKKEFYEEYKAQTSDEIPPYEELETQITATLEQEKQQESMDLILEDLMSDAEIEYK